MENTPIIQTAYGAVQAVPSDLPGVDLYRGIPIGQDTSGPNRFRAPQAAQAWGGVRLCRAWPDRFLQPRSEAKGFWYREFYQDPFYAPPISENGLAVNLYAPADAAGKALPVFVYIHGGGMVAGYNSEEEFNASHLAAQGVIVVLLQYRLGVMGWLSLPELSAETGRGASGNWAVLDLVFALQWVRQNIAAFGGDPHRVTIAGQSAGAGMVTNLLRTPLAKGLFQRAIVQSGFDGFFLGDGMMNRFLTPEEADAKNQQALRAIFGHAVTLAELRALPTEAFGQPAPDGRIGWNKKPMTLLEELNQETCRQVLDGYVFTPESVDLLRPGALDGIEIMIGGTSDEMTSLVGDAIWEMQVPPEQAKAALEKEYGVGCSLLYPTATVQEGRFSVLRAKSDQSLQKYRLCARLTEQNANHRTFAYYFTQTPPGEHPEMFGAYHSAELWYMFDSLRDKKEQRSWTPEDRRMAELMSRYWMNFVKCGDPNADGLPAWSPCDGSGGYAFAVLGGGTMHMSAETDEPQRDRHHMAYLQAQQAKNGQEP